MPGRCAPAAGGGERGSGSVAAAQGGGAEAPAGEEAAGGAAERSQGCATHTAQTTPDSRNIRRTIRANPCPTEHHCIHIGPKLA
eukprot:29578-Prorocentrum_minimum.AAC.2